MSLAGPHPTTGAAVDLGGILGCLADAVVAADADGRIVYANAAVQPLLGWDADDLVGRPLDTIVPASMRSLHRAAFERYVATGEGRLMGHPVRLNALHRDGSEVPVELTLSAGAAPRVYVGSLRGVRERLGDAEERFRLLVETTDAVFWEAAPGGSYTFVSQRAERLLGYPADLWVGNAGLWTEVILHPDDRERVVSARRETTVSGVAATLEYRVRSQGGRVVWVRDQMVAVRGAEDEVRGLRGVMVDITADKQAERRREAQFAATRALSGAGSLREASPAVMAALSENLDWRVASLWIVGGRNDRILCVEVHETGAATARFRDATLGSGFNRGEGIPGEVWRRAEPIWVPDVQAESNYPRRSAAVADGLHASYCLPIVVAGRVIGALEFLTDEVREPDQDVVGVMTGVAAQVGQLVERRRAEQALRLQHALLQSQSEATLDAILVLGPDNTILFTNKRLLEIGGLVPEDLVGASGEYLAHRARSWVADEVALEKLVSDALAAPDGRLRRELELADGRTLDVYTTPLTIDDEAAGRAWYLRDVTDVKEQAESLGRLATTLQASLLPPELPRVSWLDAEAAYRPATQGISVGGDFYDLFDTGAGWVAVIGDVSGKGAAAAALTAMVRYSIRSASMQERDAAAVLRAVNEGVLRSTDDERFCTVSYVKLLPDPAGARIEVACAGHPLPLVVRRSGEIESIGLPGPPVGMFPGAEVGTGETIVRPGETVVLITDGVLEARRSDGQLFGASRLRAVLSMLPAHTAREVVEGIVREVFAFEGGTNRDDVAVLAVRVPE